MTCIKVLDAMTARDTYRTATCTFPLCGSSENHCQCTRSTRGEAHHKFMFMNNPTMGALVEILKHKNDPFYNYPNLKEEEIFILSIGTGHHSKNISKNSSKWGKLKWIKPSIDIMMWGNNQAIDYQAKEGMSFPDNSSINYLRIDVNIEDERFADMANSDGETIEYLQSRVKSDYLNNATLQNELSKFIQDTGL